MSRIDSKTEKTSSDGTEKFPLSGNQWMTTQRVIDVAKAYADSLAANLGKRQTVRAATTAPITISTALNNADTLDGVTLATGNLVLVKDQSAPEQNGIYVVGASPARFSQFDTYDEHPGTLVIVQEGTANADTKWLCTSNVGGTLNTTAIDFAQDTAVSVAEDLTTAETDTTLVLSPDGLGGVEWRAETGGGGGGGSGAIAIFDHHADVGNVGTGEDDLYSDTVIAGQLATNDDKIFAEYGGVVVSSATATREIKAYFGGTMIFDTGVLTFASLSAAWTLKILIIRVSSSVVRYECTFATEGTTLGDYTSAGEVTGLTLSSTNVLKITGEAASTGAATNDIVAKLGTVWYMPYAGAPAASGAMVQKVGTETGAVATGTTGIPNDDTIPQNTEGDEYMTLAITPTDTGNVLYITVTIHLSTDTATRWLQAALFQDSTANALAATMSYVPDIFHTAVLTFTHKMTAGTTSSTTFKVRAGLSNTGTTTFNGVNGSRYMGGVLASSIVIEEITP